MKESKFSPREAAELLDLQPQPVNDFPFPERYKYLAVAAYERGEIGDSDLAHYLRCDIVEAREIAAIDLVQPGSGFHGRAERVAARLRQVAAERDSLIGQGLVMPDAAIDACCLIDLLASGDAEAILRASGFTWHLPSAVQGEVQYRRQHDPAQPGKIVKVPVDLSGSISSGVLTVCDPQNQQELDRYTHYATLFRSDGEAMCLALAEQRGWVVADHRRTPGRGCGPAVPPQRPVRLNAGGSGVVRANLHRQRRPAA